ncbi:RpiB/LacA/LacB family sugar-phosphate isomerase [Candidatus Nanosyncoccus nanoralicus]|jgi:sugar-phosphate isomerase, RpiB/LacA/LacB family|uniref:Ribose-5-phosphate isomerase B n=1 Tax=Candidatus Nanosyncoccus nanoralicus TaxID=2171996 RepID=A0ABY0FJE7_9BACT|nr:RpiB/LacA/LacB family sugar-phosphate isomerase [Candidatus Nanosyncoccus nanoralicus]RYC73138.1 Ribose-5-phosphate isomerase B [Candidatus Nanosyncoccus nanoralicus]
MPRIFIGSDHRGFVAKQHILATLANTEWKDSYEIVDLGPETIRPDDDFNDYAIAVSRAVRETANSRGILICGSAHGIAIQANRFKGIRAICGYTPELVRLGRLHNDANVLCLSSDFMDDANIDQAIDMFLRGNFLPEERYIRRNQRLDEESIY